MTRLCFVGDSHLAPVKMAWQDTDRVKAEFFPVRILDDSGMIWEGSRLVPENGRARRKLAETVGADGFTPTDYDAVIAVGLNMGVNSAMHMLGAYRPFGWVGNARRQLISDAMLTDFMADSIVNSRSARIMRSVQEASGVALFVVPVPNPSTILLRHRRLGWMPEDYDTDIARVAQQAFRDVLEKEFPQSWSYLHQATETMDENCWTKIEYMQYPDKDDPYHANKEFGKILIDRLLSALRLQARREHSLNDTW